MASGDGDRGPGADTDADPQADPHDLRRFVDAQAPVYAQVRAELAAAHKRSHWMWFVFPQLRGLGRSAMAHRFGIASRAEAVAYLGHPLLGERLRECTGLMLAAPAGASALAILGAPDDLKFRSSMTLFAEVAAAPRSPFAAALDRFFARPARRRHAAPARAGLMRGRPARAGGAGLQCAPGALPKLDAFPAERLPCPVRCCLAAPCSRSSPRRPASPSARRRAVMPRPPRPPTRPAPRRGSMRRTTIARSPPVPTGRPWCGRRCCSIAPGSRRARSMDDSARTCAARWRHSRARAA